MRRLINRLLISFCIAFGISSIAVAENRLWRMPLDRPDAFQPIFIMEHANPTATLILLPGGDSGIGQVVNGNPTNSNFLVRSRDLFFTEGFNVLIAFRPTDMKELDYSYRITNQHVGELDKIIDWATKKYGKPIWLVGTSRGTISASVATIKLGSKKIAGLVVTSSVTSGKPGALPSLDLKFIEVPTLVVHHDRDTCKVCSPREVRRVFDGLKNAPVKKLEIVQGGSNPRGDGCQEWHWHGFVNYEPEAVKLITNWIKSPNS